MRRRTLLAALGTSVPLAGCLGESIGKASPRNSQQTTTASDVEVTAPTVSPGESATITIIAPSITQLRFRDVPTADVAIEYDSVAFSPSPSTVWDVSPPTWQWSRVRNVTGDVPFTIPESVSAGDHRYSIATKRGGEDAERTASFTITVKA